MHQIHVGRCPAYLAELWARQPVSILHTPSFCGKLLAFGEISVVQWGPGQRPWPGVGEAKPPEAESFLFHK